MSCDLNNVRNNVNNIIDSIIKGNAKSITKSGDRFIITYGSSFNVKDRSQAYNMAVSKIESVNNELSKRGYSLKFGPYVSIDQSYSNRIIIHKHSLDKLINAYELRNKAEKENRDLAELVNEVYNQRDYQYAQERVDNERENFLEDEIKYDIDIDVNEFSEVLQDKQNLLSYLQNRRKSEIDLDKKNDLTQKINRLKDQIKDLQNKDIRSFDLLIKMAKSDIDVVKKILNNNPGNEVLYYAMPLIRNYAEFITTKFENVISLMDNKEKAEFDSIMSDLVILANKDKNLLLQEADKKTQSLVNKNIIYANGNAIEVDDIKNYGIFKASRQLGNVQDVNNPILQSLFKLINAAKTRLNILATQFQNNNKKIVDNLIKFQKNNGLKKDNYYDYMIVTDPNGKRTKKYVSKYNFQYDVLKKSSSKDDRERFAFYVNNHTFKFNKEAWEVRKKELEREFDLVKSHTIELTEEEISKGLTIEEKLESELEKFIDANSSEKMFRMFEEAKKNGITNKHINFFKKYSKSGRMKVVKIDDELVYPIEFEASEEFIDPKWTAIQNMSNSDPRKVFYNHFVENIKNSYKRMNTVDDWADWSYIPEKSKKGSLLNEAYNSMVNSISQNISTRNQVKDIVTGEYTKDIPKYFQKDRFTVDEMSFDLGNILHDFYAESIRFKEMYTIQDDVDFLLAALKNIPTFETNRRDKAAKGDNNQPIVKTGDSNLYRMAQYYVNAQMYNETQTVEGETNIKIGSKETKDKIKAIEKEMNALELSDEDKEIAIQYIDNDKIYNGKNENLKNYIDLGKEWMSLQPLLKTVTGSKIGNSLIGFTGLKLIGFNLFGGIAETLQGLYSLNLASSGGKWFNSGTATRALLEVMKSANPGSNSKVRNLAKYFGTVHNKILGVDMQSNKFTEAAYAQYKAASYLINNTYLVAMLKSRKIKDRDGKEHILYDVLNINNDGNFTLNGNFDQIYSDEKGIPSQALLDLIQDYREMITYNRDRNREFDPIELDSKFWGRAIGQFKSNWMIKGFMLRFQDYQRIDDNKEVKGFYRSLSSVFKLPTTKNVLGQEVKDKSIKGFTNALTNGFTELAKMSIFGRLAGFKPSDELSELDISNLKMFIREATWALNLLILITIGTALASGDDDDDNLPLYKYVINQSSRLLRDITTYSSPTSLMSITKNPFPFMSSVKDMFDLGTKVLKSPLLISSDYDLDDLGIKKSLESNIPLIRQIRSNYNKVDKIIQYKE